MIHGILDLTSRPYIPILPEQVMNLVLLLTCFSAPRDPQRVLGTMCRRIIWVKKDSDRCSGVNVALIDSIRASPDRVIHHGVLDTDILQ